MYEKLKKYEDEIIIPVKGYENFYLVSNYGRVFSLNYRRTGKIKELSISYLKNPKRVNKSKYARAKMYFINKNTPTAIHIIVAKTFLKRKKGKNQVNHIDGNKSNNHVSNLEWVNNSENIIHAFKTGLQPCRKGENHNLSLINDKTAKKIKKMIKNNISCMDISRKLSVSKHIVYDIKRNRTWKHINI